LIRGFGKKRDLRETWRAWKPVEQIHIPEWRQIGLSVGKTITRIIGSIRKLTTDYFEIYGRDVKKDAVAIDAAVMSDRSITNEPDEITEINGP